jgi:hypothetical protein
MTVSEYFVMEDELKAVDGSPLAPESVQMIEYLHKRAAELNAGAIRARISAAAADLEGVVRAVRADDARLRPIAGKWTIAEVVDHMAQTNVRAAEELRHLIAGRRPPLPPVYEALRSGAGQWAPWNVLVEELCDANRAMIDAIDGGVDAAGGGPFPTVRTVVVALRDMGGGNKAPQIFFAELAWKEYALLQRLHLLDHRRQIKELCAAAGHVSH